MLNRSVYRLYSFVAPDAIPFKHKAANIKKMTKYVGSELVP